MRRTRSDTGRKICNRKKRRKQNETHELRFEDGKYKKKRIKNKLRMQIGRDIKGMMTQYQHQTE